MNDERRLPTELNTDKYFTSIEVKQVGRRSAATVGPWYHDFKDLYRYIE